MRRLITSLLIPTFGLVSPALAEVIKPPKLSVSAEDGRLAGYSATLPLDLSTDGEKALFTAKVAGSLEHPTYNLDLNLADRPQDGVLSGRTVGLSATWNDKEAAIRSSLARSFGFGLLPRANYIRVSMDMDAAQTLWLRDQLPLARASVRSTLTLDGHSLAAISFGGGSLGDEGVDFSLTRPFDLPAEFTVSLRADSEAQTGRLKDGRVMVRLVKARF